jgi:serine/threonine-protein kinase
LFTGENEAQTMAMVLSEMVVEPPSRRAPGIPKSLDELILRGLNRDPAKRFASAREMARALESAVPLVSTSEIGEWVERLAGVSLADRAERIAQIESSSSNLGPSVMPPPMREGLASAPEFKEPGDYTERLTPGPGSKDTSAPSIQIQGAMQVPTTPLGSRRSLTLLAIPVVAALAGFGLWRLLGPKPDAGAPAAAHIALAAESAPAARPVQAPTSASAEIVAPPPPPSASVAPSATAPATVAASAKRIAPAPPPKQPRPAPPQPGGSLEGLIDSRK